MTGEAANGLDQLKVLLRYQASAIALSAEHQLLVIEKSRRTGITYGFAADAVLTAAPAVRPSAGSPATASCSCVQRSSRSDGSSGAWASSILGR